MRFWYLMLLLAFICTEKSVAKIMCKNENNSDVDWYILIKFPSGPNFFYLSSESNGREWISPHYLLDNDKNLVALTLKQAYNAKDNQTFFAFYNDEKPKQINHYESGHLKGVVNFDKATGYWMVHSVPKFPAINEYAYPYPRQINGQSFICVSLNVNYLNSIVIQLLMMYAHVYKFHLPAYFAKDTTLESNLISLVHNQHYVGFKHASINLTTIGKVSLVHFGKSKGYFADLYDSLIAPSLKSSLFVESWMNGNGDKLPSNCGSLYKVFNVKKVKIHTTEFDERMDHSKWAVTSNGTTVTCIGDINRMTGQSTRGGGSLCIFHPNVWKAFSSAVLEYENCTKMME